MEVSGVPGARPAGRLDGGGDPSPGTSRDPREREILRQGSAGASGAPGAGNSPMGILARDSGVPGKPGPTLEGSSVSVGVEPSAGSSTGTAGDPGAEAGCSAGRMGAPGARARPAEVPGAAPSGSSAGATGMGQVRAKEKPGGDGGFLRPDWSPSQLALAGEEPLFLETVPESRSASPSGGSGGRSPMGLGLPSLFVLPATGLSPQDALLS